MKLLMHFQQRGTPTETKSGGNTNMECLRFQTSVYTVTDIEMQLMVDFPDAIHTSAVNWSNLAKAVLRSESSIPTNAGHRLKSFLQNSAAFCDARPDFFSEYGVWPCCNARGPTARGCQTTYHYEDSNAVPSLIFSVCLTFGCQALFFQDTFNFDFATANDVLLLFGVGYLDVVDRLVNNVEAISTTTACFREMFPFLIKQDDTTCVAATDMERLSETIRLCSGSVSSVNPKIHFFSLLEDSRTVLKTLVVFGATLTNVGPRHGCLCHCSTYKCGAKHRVQRAKLQR